MLSNEIVKFAAGNTDFFVAFQDYYNHVNKMGAYDESVSLSEKSEKINSAFFAEVEKRSGVTRSAENAESWAANPMVQWAAFAVIDAVVNSVLPQTLNPTMGMFTDLRFTSYGDIVKFKVKPRSLFVVSNGAHGERTSFRQKKFDGDYMMAPVEHIVTVYTDMYRVLAGKEDLASFIRLVVLSVETRMGKDAADALATGLSTGSYPSQLSISGAFDVQQFITLGETVEAYNYGARPVILGTATALAKVLPDSSLGYRMNADANGGSIELIKNFYGYDLIRMPQYATGSNFGLALDPNALYFVSPSMDKLVKGVVSNSLTNSNQFYDNADITQNFTYRKDWDFAFLSAAWGAKYEITD